MAALGVKFWPGNFDDREALESAIAGTSSVFLNFFPDFTDPGANLRQAKLIMSVALAAGVEQVVYTSGLGVFQPERMDCWDPQSPVAAFLGSKADIEAAVRTSGFKHWTILRPGVFMTNFTEPAIRQYGAFAQTGVLETAWKSDTPLPLVSPRTIGAFSSAAILEPAGFHAKQIDYADEFATPEDVVKKLSATIGKVLKARYRSEQEIEQVKEQDLFVGGQVISREIWKLIDMDRVHQLGIPLSTFDAFLEEYQADVVETFSQAP
jgi:uncharacterized protein YbjT (DUF2867 family)